MLAAILDDVIDPQQYYNPLYFSLQCRHLFFGGRLLNLVFVRYFGFAKRRGLGEVKRWGGDKEEKETRLPARLVKSGNIPSYRIHLITNRALSVRTHS